MSGCLVGCVSECWHWVRESVMCADGCFSIWCDPCGRSWNDFEIDGGRGRAVAASNERLRRVFSWSYRWDREHSSSATRRDLGRWGAPDEGTVAFVVEDRSTIRAAWGLEQRGSNPIRHNDFRQNMYGHNMYDHNMYGHNMYGTYQRDDTVHPRVYPSASLAVASFEYGPAEIRMHRTAIIPAADSWPETPRFEIPAKTTVRAPRCGPHHHTPPQQISIPTMIPADNADDTNATNAASGSINTIVPDAINTVIANETAPEDTAAARKAARLAKIAQLEQQENNIK